MSFQFKKAVRENVNILVAFAGPSGSGKTYSALCLAEGLANGRPIAFIDTEARRGLHYAEQFDFEHTEMTPPFRPARFLEAIESAEAAGAGVIVIDSFSHEYDGDGGILDWASELEASGTKGPAAWKAPKLAHKKLMNKLLQARAHLIFCLRADEKIEVAKENGRTVIRPLGWQPICEKRFMFEMTASFTLTADNPGKPNFALPHKLQEQHRDFFPAGQFIDREAGRALGEWAAGGVAHPPIDRDDLISRGQAAAVSSMDDLRDFWSALSPEEKHAVGGADQLAAWKAVADRGADTS